MESGKAVMRISVIIPCFNAEKYIAWTLGSILEQSRLPDEIIVVDDHSTDRSVKVVESFGERVRIVSNPRRGACHARNLGFSLSTGDAVMFLDADDVLAPDALSGLVTALQENPTGVALAPWYRLEKRGDEWIERPASCRRRRDDEHLLDAWLTGWWHPPCAVMWSREAYEKTGGWDPGVLVNQDGDLMMRALVADVPVSFSAEGHAYYRRLPDMTSQSSRRHSREGRTAQLDVIERIAKMIEDAGRLPTHAMAIIRALEIFSRESREFPDLAERAGRMAEEIETPMVRLRRRARRLVSTSARLLTMPARKLKRRFASNESHKDEPGTTRVVNYGLAAAEQALARARRSRARGPIPHMNHGGDGALGVAADVQIPSLPGTNSARASMQSGRSHRPMHRADLQPGDAGRARTYHTDAPTVSVVIPTYNRAHVVHRAIDSVLGQTFADFELIVVDDGSTDGTEAVLSTYTDPRIRYLVQLVNRGVSAARNRGIKEARGEFVAFLDSDDEWFPEKLERQVNRFRRAPDNVGLVYCGVETVGRPTGPWIYEPAHRGDIYNKLLERNVIHTGSGAMIRRSVVCAAGYFDEDIPAIEDYDYWLRIARHYRFDYVPDPLMRYYDERAADRKSLDVGDNIEARDYFFFKHRRSLRRARVAHRFLRETARRSLKPADADRRQSRRLILKAIREQPFDADHYPFALYHFFPRLHDGLLELRNGLRRRPATSVASSH